MTTATRKTPTAAQRAKARARKDRPLVTPPPPLRRTQGAVRDLELFVAGRRYRIGANVDGATPWEMTVEGAATVTIPVRSPDGTLMRRLGDEARLQRDGARIIVDTTVYVVSGVSDDGAGLATLTVQDEVAWRLGLFDSPMVANRATTTRAGFIRRMVDEATRRPRAGMRAFIPEVRDIQQIAKPAAVDRENSEVRTGDPTEPSGGFGTGTRITVKGQTATAAQRSTIDSCLAEAARLGASRRVMVAVVMCITQESNGGDPAYTNRGDAAGPDSRGPFQQRAPWGPVETRMDPAGATRLFLTSSRGHGLNGWAAVHGSIKNAAGNLSHAINKVQISAYPDAYAQWQAEAERTVATWSGGEAGGPEVPTTTNTRTRRYEFTRGEKGGERETSWEASGRLAEEVGWLRWAAGNTLYFVSAEELRKAAPSARISGDEAWLTALPTFEWGTRRPASECQLSVMTDRFMVMPGSVVLLNLGGPLDGRWLVHAVSGERLDSPLATVTLRRPTLKRLEPAPETETVTSGGGGASPPGTDPTMAGGSVVGGFAKPLPPGYPAPGPHGSARNAFGGDAVDIMVAYGTPVYAIQAGTIGSQIGPLSSSSPYLQGERLHLITTDGNDWYYAHLSQISVTAGQSVQAGQQLGLSGRANGVDHLHLEDKLQTVRQRI